MGPEGRPGSVTECLTWAASSSFFQCPEPSSPLALQLFVALLAQLVKVFSRIYIACEQMCGCHLGISGKGLRAIPLSADQTTLRLERSTENSCGTGSNGSGAPASCAVRRDGMGKRHVIWCRHSAELRPQRHPLLLPVALPAAPAAAAAAAAAAPGCWGARAWASAPSWPAGWAGSAPRPGTWPCSAPVAPAKSLP